MSGDRGWFVRVLAVTVLSRPDGLLHVTVGSRLESVRLEQGPRHGKRAGSDEVGAEGHAGARHAHGAVEAAALAGGLIGDRRMRDSGPPEYRSAFLAIALEPRQLEAGQDVRLLAHLERPPRVVAQRHRHEAERDEHEADHDGEGRRREEPCEEPSHVWNSAGGLTRCQ